MSCQYCGGENCGGSGGGPSMCEENQETGTEINIINEGGLERTVTIWVGGELLALVIVKPHLREIANAIFDAANNWKSDGKHERVIKELKDEIENLHLELKERNNGT